MPRLLPQRLAADSCGEFLAAAECRYEEGLILLNDGRRAAAIYLWGYSVEMLLKAAVFRAMGSSPHQPIVFNDLQAARELALDNRIPWQGRNYHFLPGWAELLLCVRAFIPGTGYRDLAFRSTMHYHAITVSRFWRETIRFHKNNAYSWDVNVVRSAVEWFLGNARDL